MDFADLLAPVPVRTFLDETYDRVPLHIPATGEAGEHRRALLSWSRLNALLGIAGHWRQENIKLLLNGAPLPTEHYLDDVATSVGFERRADPAKIESLLALGASLVADAVENACAELKQVTTMLGGRFLGNSSANAYCSFQGVQAFRSHLDLHDVFAVHCEGEKVWRIYRNRAADPVDQHGGPDAQAEIDAAKGPVLMEVRMRPGDLLYIPRGYYHDALAWSEASLHITFSVARHSGRILFRILEELAMRDPLFRAWLPDARADGGRLLADRLALLSERAAELMRTPAFLSTLVNEQLELARPFRELALPERPRPDFFVRSEHPCRVELDEEGATLAWDGGEAPLGLMEAPARWFLGQSLVSFQQLAAHYPQHGEEALRALVQLLQRAGLVAPRA
ncbi:cupin domain-containing protein [Sphingomonas sp. LB-2]|uniref:cupin domain-containing protein n=1 Tax=Sphingomonas caeni TaxID=2984949 RepID=UPI00223010D6|nr:cupin domain-containing protein [Sphingomonas caeni]MCW3849103.1 cupin domain-containing protein [Sphingomonas caeni]